MLRQVYKVMGADPPVDPEHMLIDLVEWLLRLPARSPRRVHRSWMARTKILSPLEIQGLEQVATGLKAGGNMSPFLGDASRKIRQRSREVSKIGTTIGKKRWQPDWMFSDWGIHHFHLGPDLEAKGEKVLRSARVLFAYLTQEDAYLLDVLPHRRTDGGIAWAQKGVLETLCREWPSVMERYELRGILGPSPLFEPTSAQVHSLRQAGLNSPVMIDGKTYMGPGLGLASDRSSTRAVKLSSEIRWELHQMEKLFRDSADNAQAHLFVAADASVGFFIPSRNTAISYVPARTSDCRMTWFFQRLLQEVPIFRGAPQGAVWLRQGIRQ